MSTKLNSLTNNKYITKMPYTTDSYTNSSSKNINTINYKSLNDLIISKNIKVQTKDIPEREIKEMSRIISKSI